MSKNDTKSTTVTVGIYTFIISGHRIVVASKGNKDEEELRAITKAYEEYKYRNKYRGRPLNGEFRWCLNPDCNYAFYVRRFKINQGQGVCCSHGCAGIVFGCPKGKKIGKPKSELEEPAQISRKEIKQKEKIVVKTELKTVKKPRPYLLKGFKCSVCGEILKEIYGSPGRCPICKGDVIFMVVEMSSEDLSQSFLFYQTGSNIVAQAELSSENRQEDGFLIELKYEKFICLGFSRNIGNRQCICCSRTC